MRGHVLALAVGLSLALAVPVGVPFAVALAVPVPFGLSLAVTVPVGLPFPFTVSVAFDDAVDRLLGQRPGGLLGVRGPVGRAVG